MKKCPRCGSVSSPTGKEWNYGYLHVKKYQCSKCKKSFMAYYRDGKLTHTIPKTK